MTVKEALCREYVEWTREAERLSARMADRREKLKKLLKADERCGGLVCLRIRHLEAQTDALRASGDWRAVSREQVDPEKLALLLRLNPEAASDGRIRVWHDKRLVADKSRAPAAPAGKAKSRARK